MLEVKGFPRVGIVEVVPYLYFESKMFNLSFEEDGKWDLVQSIALAFCTTVL